MYCQQRFTELEQSVALIREVRVLGLMSGVELTREGGPVVQKCLERGLFINCT